MAGLSGARAAAPGSRPPGAKPGLLSPTVLVLVSLAVVVGGLTGFAVGSREDARSLPDIRAVAVVGGPRTSVGEALLPVLTVNAGAEAFRVVDVRLAAGSGVPWRLISPTATDVAPGDVVELLVRFEQECTGPPSWGGRSAAVEVEVEVEGNSGERRVETVEMPAALVGLVTGTVGDC